MSRQAGIRLRGAWNLLAAAAAWSAALAGGRAGAAPVYDVTDLSALNNDTASYAYGINNAGQVVFRSFGGPDSVVGGGSILYSNGKLTNVSSPMGGSVLGINNLGQTVGDSPSVGIDFAINDSGQVAGGFNALGHAYIYKGGVETDLGTLGGATSVAYGINDSGEVVGASDAKDGFVHPFLYSHGTMTGLDIPTAFGGAEATAINNSGQVAGGASPGSRFPAFLYSDGQMQSIGLGQQGGLAFALNNLGDVVGVASTPVGGHAFLYSGKRTMDLNDLIPPGTGWTMVNARGINDSGWIVVDAEKDNLHHAFLLTPHGALAPVPEPGSLTLLGLGLAAGLPALARTRRAGRPS